jgi:hypothetical protein
MTKGFVQSGKLGPIPGTRRLGQAIPIVNASSYDSCPAGYTRNALGVCMLGPQVVSGSSVVYTTPFILGGRARR